MTKQSKASILLLATCTFCAGCAQAPSVDVMGSFFPSWMICLIAGVILGFATRSLLTRFRLESEVGPLALFYPCTVLFFSALLWLILFR